MADPSTSPRRRFFVSPSVLASALVWLGLALALRIRIHLGAGLPSDQPLRWFLLAIATDLAVAGAIVLLSWLASPITRRLTGPLGAAVFLAALLLQFAWSEFAIYFGHPPAPQSLQLGFHPRILLGAAQGKILLSLLGSIALLIVLAFAARLVVIRSGIANRIGGAAVAVVAGAAALLAIALPVPHRADIAENAIAGVARMVRAGASEQMSGAIPVVRPRRGPLPTRWLVPRDGRAMISDAYPLAYTPPEGRARLVPPFSEKLNVVIILLEGIRADESAAFGGSPEGLMPNLNRLAREGIRLGRMFSTGTFTPEGEIACWYGTLASPYEMLIRQRPDVELYGLPEILRANGWKDLLWIHPGDATLYLSTRFYEKRGFRVTDGRDFPPEDPKTNWGYSDRALFRRSIEILDGAREPFASMILTVSNHHPFQVPSDAKRIYEVEEAADAASLGQVAGHHTAQMYRTVHYTDESLGHFFELARSKPWFERTLFVILGDHGSPIPPPGGVRSEHHLLNLRHEVAAILYSPRLPGGRVTPGPSTQADIVPTLLGLLGIEGPRSGTGLDLLAEAPGGSPRAIISWVSVGNVLTVRRGSRVYHARASLRSDLSGWDLADETLIDEETDPDGKVNIIDGESAKIFRADARVYLEDYSALVVEGKSGVPPG